MDLTAALNILTDALARWRKEDMRTVEVFAALDALAINATSQWPFEQFRKALDSDNVTRSQPIVASTTARCSLDQPYRYVCFAQCPPYNPHRIRPLLYPPL